MKPKRSTRMGPAIRHASMKLDSSGAALKVLMIVSDGFPQDHDYGPDRGDHEYGLRDTARALLEAEGRGVETFCVTVDRSGHDYLRRNVPRGSLPGHRRDRGAAGGSAEGLSTAHADLISSRRVSHARLRMRRVANVTAGSVDRPGLRGSVEPYPRRSPASVLKSSAEAAFLNSASPPASASASLARDSAAASHGAGSSPRDAVAPAAAAESRACRSWRASSRVSMPQDGVDETGDADPLREDLVEGAVALLGEVPRIEFRGQQGRRDPGYSGREPGGRRASGIGESGCRGWRMPSTVRRGW